MHSILGGREEGRRERERANAEAVWQQRTANGFKGDGREPLLIERFGESNLFQVSGGLYLI